MFQGQVPAILTRFGLGVSLACAALGCQREPEVDLARGRARHTLPDGSAAYAVGARAQSAHYDMRVAAPDDCTPRDRRGLPEGIIRLGVDVTLWARGDVQVPANPYYALLIDGRGVVYEATLGGCEPPLPSVLLTNGESARGWLAFDVPRASQGLVLSYWPRLLLPDTRGPAGTDELMFALSR